MQLAYSPGLYCTALYTRECIRIETASSACEQLSSPALSGLKRTNKGFGGNQVRLERGRYDGQKYIGFGPSARTLLEATSFTFG